MVVGYGACMIGVLYVVAIFVIRRCLFFSCFFLFFFGKLYQCRYCCCLISFQSERITFICLYASIYVFVWPYMCMLLLPVRVSWRWWSTYIHTFFIVCVCVCVCESRRLFILWFIYNEMAENVFVVFFIYCCCFIFLLDGYFFVLLLVPLVALSTQIQSLHSSISVTFPTRIFVVCFMHTLCCFSMFSIFSTILATVFLLLVMTLVCMANVGGTAMCGEQRRYFFQSSLPILPSFGLPIIVEYSSIFTKTKMYNSDVNS